MIRRPVVAGYGNPLRQDDAAGRCVAELVGERLGERVRVLVASQPLPEWSEVLAEADLVFFVDATLESGGGVRAQRLRPNSSSRLLSGHAIEAGDVLRLTQAVYGRAPETYLVSVPVTEVGFGEGLSPHAKRAAERAVRLIAKRIVN